MSHFDAKINQLVVLRPGKQKTYIRAFTTKPSKELMARNGKIFGLIEIESTNKKTDELIDLIIEELKNGYYFRKNVGYIDDSVSINDQFEAALKKTNIAIAAYIESEQVSLNLDKINIIVGLIHNQDLYFTVIGNIGAILLFNVAAGNFRIINILDTTKAPQSAPDPLKFFSQIISGKIRSRDILFITTANIFDYLSLERIKKIMTEQSAVNGIGELKAMLEKIKAKENFGSLVLEVEKIVDSESIQPTLQQFNYREAATKDSMKGLIKTENETAKLLTPSIIPEMKKISGFFGGLADQVISGLRSGLKKTAAKPTGMTELAKNKFNIRPAIGKLSLPKINLPTLPALPAFDGLSQLKNKFTTSPLWKRIIESFYKIFAGPIAKFKRLPKSSKLLFVTTVMLAGLFGGSIIWLQISNYNTGIQQKYDQIIADVEYKINFAASSLVYRDENSARQLLVDAKTSLTQAATKTKAQKDKVAGLNAEIEEQLQKLRHVTEIAEPAQLFNFANLDTTAKIANLMVLSKGFIYSQNLNNGLIYKGNLNGRALTAAASPAVTPGTFIFGTAVSDASLIFCNDQKQLFTFNATNDQLQKTAINTSGNITITDLSSFKGLLYVLDAKGNQIYKYTNAKDNWGNPVSWLKAGTYDFSNAVSLTVDGSIYILKSSGEVIKLANGKAADFSLKTIEPAFNSPTRIKTTETSKYLYILDPANKRLVVIAKTDGNLTAQYHADSFTDLKDFIVNESAKQIYFLNGTAVFGVPTTHLK